MKTKNFNLLFYLKKVKGYESGDLPIYLRISVDGKRSEATIGRGIEPEKWDEKRGKARGNTEDARSLNAHLDSILAKLKRIHTRLLDSEEEISADTLRNELDGKGKKSKMLLEIFSDHNKQMESLIGRGFGANTHKTFKSSLKHAREFVEWKFKRPDYELRKVDFNFIKDYDFFLRTEKNCIPISADKYVKHLKKIILLCLANRWIVVNPFLHYKSTAKPSPRTFLTKHELDVIRNKALSIERLNLVRDIFIFSCYTGLAYIDVQKLTPNEIAQGDDGKLWVFTKRHKTDTPSHIPLLKEALEIIENYKDHPVCVRRSLLLPVLTNQRMNSYLKEIGDLCGITKTLTFHMARHTFATTITLSNGVPMETVSKMLGHNSIKTTQHYAKVLDSKTSEDMQKLEERLYDKATTTGNFEATGPEQIEMGRVVSMFR
ncbi:site-specific integrase [Mucilaginibacter rubeus]|uniref:Site-specific integrase n=1 Tax=Mucilaginibacter rubeus TaxID=2027860 RepID=A0AAE6MK23_9SPHI|nr:MULTISPECIES: site-specific integrase [Mucilaginibacter]QEM06303.1 site-specific integrase [Mucilaginibacter rubeus]QEM18886.1 site-specific integrase [Mucilaginibacter gossypii]QTE44571.1 site-specific integrase [Mucilaginibacter rubeus]QTE51169.1 site-specific integrase [Mucilaginibacter rubeus]QTE56257.1 site-specific integrase [Mucilaginibacter rubeus]